MKSAVRALPIVLLAAAFLLLLTFGYQRRQARMALPVAGFTVAHHAVLYDLSPPLIALRAGVPSALSPDCRANCAAPGDDDDDDDQPPQGGPGNPPTVASIGSAIEQKTQGARPPAAIVDSFDGLGVGFDGPQGPAVGRNPSDNSLAVGLNHIVQIVNSYLAVFSKKGDKYSVTGKVLYGAVPTNTIFSGFGGPCEENNNSDAVVRYDQLADRWLVVMPIFNRIIGRPDEPFAMCYALSEGADPMGAYYRYEFRRELFPDYPRPAIWTDGYYLTTSAGDNLIRKNACVADRANMLKGRDASEQCIGVEGATVLNNADLDGQNLPPTGAAAILMAVGGTQFRRIVTDDGIYAWQFHVDWDDPAKTKLSEPVKISVAPYHYLCDGQLSRCVTQPDTPTLLDSQGDKLMQRVIYRNFGDHESIVAVQSVASSVGGGGVRWYEFRMGAQRNPVLYQQSTFVPDLFSRWMASPGMDRTGNLGIGYTFGGAPNYPGQRFAARLAGDPLGQLTLRETIVAAGAAPQKDSSRWEDYTTTAMDPSDDCTFWYVGDYYRASAVNYSTRIASLRLPGCLRRRVSGVAYLDLNHNGIRDVGEPGVANLPLAYRGGQSGVVRSGSNGAYNMSLPADPAYETLAYTLAVQPSGRAVWAPPANGVTVTLASPAGVSNLDFAAVCTVANRGGAGPQYWGSARGRAVLDAQSPAWLALVNDTFHADLKSYDQFRKWIAAPGVTVQLAAAALNVAYGEQDGNATLFDPVFHDWPSVRTLIARVAGLKETAPYLDVLQQLNANTLPVTPSTTAVCGAY